MRSRITMHAIGAMGGGLAHCFVITGAALIAIGFPLASASSLLTLDPSFGTAGSQRVGLGPAGSSLNFIRALPAGGWMTAGSVGNQKIIARFLASGDLDPAFGVDGVLQLSAIPSQSSLASFELDGTGRYLVGVLGTTCASDPCLYRLNADGSLDASFKNGGNPTLPPGNPGAWAQRILPLVGGGMLVAGQSANGTGVLRLMADGAIDPAFGAGGITVFPPNTTFPFGPFQSNPTSLRLAAGGGIYIGTASFPASVFSYVQHFDLHRMDTDGIPDSSFGVGGMVSVNAGGLNFGDVEELPGGKFIGISTTNLGGGSLGNHYLFRFDATGALDATFGVGGVADAGVVGLYTHELGAPRFARVGSQYLVPGSKDSKFALARLNADGSPDASFGPGGILIADPPPGYGGRGNAVAVGAGGEILAIGYGAVLQIGPTGSSAVKPSPVGRPLIDVVASASVLTKVLVATDGAVVVIGNQIGLDGQVALLGPNGLPRPSFGVRGHVLAGDVGTPGALWNGGALQSDGKIVIGGSAAQSLVMRLDTAGTPDPTFGGTGIVLFQSNAGSGGIDAVAVQADGNVVAAGVRVSGGVVAVHRFLSTGAPDPGFGVNGEATFNAPLPFVRVDAVLFQGGGKILVAGVVRNGTSAYRWAVVRLFANGQLDSSYGSGGTAYVTADGAGMGPRVAAAMQPGGAVVLAGAGSHTSYATLAARLTPEGQPDPAFGSGGVAVLLAGAGYDPMSIAVTAANDTLVLMSDSGGHWLVKRLLGNGSVDASFGVAWLASYGATIRPILASGGGRIVAAGAPDTSNVDERTLVQAFTIAAMPPVLPQRTFAASFGSDAGTCSANAPCRTLAQALSRTARDGEVLLLDSADFGSAAIVASVSIIAPTGVHASVSAPSNQDAITVDAGPNDTVVLRGLDLAGGLSGVVFNSGRSLHLENVTVRGFSGYNVGFFPASPARLSIKDSTLQSGGIGLSIFDSAGNAGVTLDNVRIEGSRDFGILASAGSTISIRNTLVENNASVGINVADVSGAPLALTLDRVLISGSAWGINLDGTVGANAFVFRSTIVNNWARGIFVAAASTAWLDGNRIMRNGTGVATFGGSIFSRGNNTLEANGVDGTMTGNYSGK